MEVHSPNITAKKLWNILRIAFFMMRKGFISKRKLMLDMNLMMKRGKLFGKTLGSLMFHHHPSGTIPNNRAFGLHEYEFSCNNSPNPIMFRMNSKRKHSYFPCIGTTPVDETDNKAPTVNVLPRIKYSPQCGYSLTDLAPGERRTPIPSPLLVRVSNFSMAEEGDGLGCEVDNRADEFIKKFYMQLEAQGRIAFIEYQEEEYQDMLARGI